jgi:hypothetical protein
VKLHLLLEDEIEDKLEQLIELQDYVGEYNVPCEVELVGDDLVALMHSGKKYIIDNRMLRFLRLAEDAYWYAHALRQRFELGEPVIATDANFAYIYSRDVIKGRFELGESTIAKNAEWAYAYARNIIKGRFELGESTIAKDAEWASAYARNIIKGRFELGESTIAKDAEWASAYARNIIKGRFELDEEVILKSNLHANHHKDMLKRTSD